MLLSFFRLIGKIFFREIVIEGREHLPPSGPVILALNHPNALLDPLLTLFLSPPLRLRHIAKSTLFRIPVVGSVLRRMRSIPVLRREDVSGTVDYSSFFNECVDALMSGDAVVIFPEGASADVPFVGPLKTGIARMAFLARERGLDVPIIPIGVNYEEGSIFRSSVLLLIAPPIDTSPFASLRARDAAAAVHALTAEVHRTLGEHVFQAATFQDRQLILLLENVYFESNRREEWAERYRKLKEFLPRITGLRQCCPAEMKRLRRFAARYRRLTLVAGSHAAGNPPSRRMPLLPALGPLLAYSGWVFNWVPYRIVRLLVERRKLPRSDIATMTIVWSLIVFPPAYLLEGILLGTAFGWKAGVLFALGIGPFSYLALRYFEWRETLGIRPPSPSAFFGGRWSRRTSKRLLRLRERIMREVDLFPLDDGEGAPSRKEGEVTGGAGK